MITSITWVPISPSLETLRYHKTAGELANIRAAAAITDQVMGLVPQLARPGMTERALAWELEKAMREAGAESTAFDIIVAGGPNAALPHHHPGERPLQPNEPPSGGHGRAGKRLQKRPEPAHFSGRRARRPIPGDLCCGAGGATAVRQHARPGQNGNQVDELAREVIQQAGYGENFGHGLGHGLGLDIHEGTIFHLHSQRAAVFIGRGHGGHGGTGHLPARLGRHSPGRFVPGNGNRPGSDQPVRGYGRYNRS
ncbi:MAG: aminopeptidase P family protein [Chloroflexi bacterium]|nr:aminopeptidase P family protein [Chloroflexota bacterium]